ncbi:MAG TPA: R3H domain-containing nucleic acid-binding protein [Candidatus Paceibacterota bacterium]|nr:R3H domain-containing nucleic acid-binding protein [Candidatus Paceibacterota bacterium]
MDAASLKTLTASLLAALGYESEAIDIVGEQRTVVAISSKDSRDLIGPNGDHVRALNTIARRLAETKYGEEAASFLIDINGYYEEKMEAVRANARMLAQRARLFKHDVEMEPLSPYERLVVHELFSNDPDIKTESAGEGKFRHIVLKYQGS